MRTKEPTSTSTVVLDVVLDLIRSEGYHAVQVRMVAKRARIGLDTLYRLFPTRDELIIAALSRWMATNASNATDTRPAESLYEGLVHVYRELFEPWLEHPRVLDAYVRARLRPGGERLDAEGLAVLTPRLLGLFTDVDPTYRDDVLMIVGNVVNAAVGAVAQGALPIDEILPLIERTVHRLTTDNAALAASAMSVVHREEMS
jgi:TetR/AcrR family transcriptional regulator, cholesterol catabolism regulator